MLSEHLKDLNSLGIYPLISLIIFIVGFIFVVLRVMTADKTYLKKMEELPLEANNENKTMGI